MCLNIASVNDPVNHGRFTNNIDDAQPRIKRTHRILEYHLNTKCNITGSRTGYLAHKVATKIHLSVRRLVYPRNNAAQGRLSTSGFTDEPDNLTIKDRQ